MDTLNTQTQAWLVVGGGKSGQISDPPKYVFVPKNSVLGYWAVEGQKKNIFKKNIWVA